MTTRYTVRLEAPAALAAAHRVVLAALPGHFEIIEGGVLDAALVTDATTKREARVLVAADTLTASAKDAVAIPRDEVCATIVRRANSDPGAFGPLCALR